MSTGIAFLGEIETEKDSLRYLDLCNHLRPAPLKLPVSSPPLLMKKFMANCSHVSSPSSSEESSPTSCSESIEKYSLDDKVETTPSNDGDDETVRLILHVSSMQVDNSYVIPMNRVCTPRTSKTPKKHAYAGRPVSPMDECFHCEKQSPKDLLISRYKASIPKESDFTRI